MDAPFTCPRTCPRYGDAWCRFRPILDAIGPVKVNSETVTLNVQFQDESAITTAIQAIGGTVLGKGLHKIFDGHYNGLGFTLPNWRKRLVVTADGKLQYDDYRGAWGNVKDLDRLKSEYSIGVAETKARELGWAFQRESEGLKVFHPAGGEILLRGDLTAEAFGFHGVGCHESLMALGIDGAFAPKAEFNEVQAKVEEGCA